jgi:hypothetical protein
MEKFDFDSLIEPGITMLKFGTGGSPHERLFTLTADLRYLSWNAGWFCGKMGSKCEIDMERVARINAGQTTPQFSKWESVYAKAANKSVTIVYTDSNGQNKTLNLIAPSPEIYRLFHHGFNTVVEKFKDDRRHMSADTLLLKTLWDKADADHSGFLTQAEIIQLMGAANINKPASEIKKMIKRFDLDLSGTLDFAEFVEFMKFLQKRPDIEAIWTAIVNDVPIGPAITPLNIKDGEFGLNTSASNAVISVKKFIKFWKE